MNAQKLGYLLPLSEVCEVNPRNVTGLDPDTSVTFVPMSAVDERTGSILTPEIRDYQEVAKGYTPFRNNDVLFAKITPCMENGKCAIARRLENGWGFGSTEFHILRAGDRVLPEWVYYFIRQEEVRKFAASNMTGTAGQQRVPKSVFDRLLISVPSLPIQKEIAAGLEKADAAREKRRKANQLTEQFLQSAFLEMFGDPITNPKVWRKTTLDDACTKVVDGTHFSPPMQDQGVPYITAKHLKPRGLDFYSDPTFILEEHHREIYRRCDPVPGDVLYIKDGATTGIAAVNQYEFEFSMLSSLALIRPKNGLLAPQYLSAYLNSPSVKKSILRQMAGGAIKRLTVAKIKKLTVHLPPFVIQQEFVTIVERANSLRAKQRESEKELDNLFNCLTQRAFRGELVG